MSIWLVNWSAYDHKNDFLIQIYEKKEKNIRIRVTKSA